MTPLNSALGGSRTSLLQQFSGALMRVVVTGTGGFIGSVVAAALADAGMEVVATYRRSVPARLTTRNRIRLVQADLRDIGALPHALDAVVHCAADVPAFCPDPQALYTSNVEGARALFARARAGGVRHVIFLSSMSIYGSIAAPVVTETTPSVAPDVYGQSKLEGERLLAAWAAEDAELSALTIRLPGVVGAHSRNNFLSGVLASILAGNEVVASNPGASFNNVVHVADLTAFILHRLNAPPGYDVMNIASCEPLTICEVIDFLFKAVGREPRISWAPSTRSSFSIALETMRALGYRPKSVRETLAAFASDTLREHESTSRAPTITAALI